MQSVITRKALIAVLANQDTLEMERNALVYSIPKVFSMQHLWYILSYDIFDTIREGIRVPPFAPPPQKRIEVFSIHISRLPCSRGFPSARFQSVLVIEKIQCENN